MCAVAFPTGCLAGLQMLAGDGLSALTLDGASFSGGMVSLASDAQSRTDAKGPAAGKSYRFGIATLSATPAEPFDQIVVSWNADAPAGSWLIIEARARTGDKWTNWYNLGWWALDTSVITRTSVKGQRDASGYVDCDTVFLSSKAQAAEIRLTLCSTNPNVNPRLELLTVDLCAGGRPGSAIVPRSVRGKSLPVPELSQLSYPPRGGVWCSATSVTMVLNYWAARLQMPEIATGVRETAAAVHDEAWGGTGNWTFNTAYAGTRKGIQAYCVRMSGMDDVAKWIKADVPVVISISSAMLHRDSDQPDAGHLIVCIGFDEKGDVICNDPYAKLDQGQSVRRVYSRSQLLKAWAPSNRTAYLIYPEKS